MSINIEQIILKLNTVSRMAIIENAPNTEKMLVALSKFLRYRYQSEDSTVIAETELKVAEVLCDYYNTQFGSIAEFIYEDDAKLLGVTFIPHFTLLSYYYCMLSVFGSKDINFQLRMTTKVTLIGEVVRIMIEFEGPSNMQGIYKEAYSYEPDEYGSIRQAVRRLTAVIGESNLRIHCDNDNNRLEVIIQCKE